MVDEGHSHTCPELLALGWEEKHRPIQCFEPLQWVNIWWGMGDWDRQDGSCFVERGRSKEAKQARNSLTWEARVPPGVMVTSSLSLSMAVWFCWCLWLLLLPKVLRMPRVWASTCAMLVFKDLATTVVTLPSGLCCLQGPWRIWAWAAVRAMSGYMALRQPESMLISMVPVAIGLCKSPGSSCRLRPWWYLGAML